MIRTHIIPCDLKREQADELNLESGRIYNQVLVTHWRVLRRNRHWLSHFGATKLNDWYNASKPKKLYAHTIDAAQNAFYAACKVAKSLKKIDPKHRYPHWNKKFRTTTWFGTGCKRKGDTLELTNGKGNPKITIVIPKELRECTKVLEVRLVFDKKARKYDWHLVVENGKQAKLATGTNTVGVDPGEIHPAVIGDEQSSTVITCRERRSEQRAHSRRLAIFATKLSKKKKGSRRYKKLVRSKVRMKAKHERVTRDLAHKISHAIVAEAVARNADTIVYGDVRDIADGVDCGKVHNQRTSQWNHGKVRAFVEYKAEAEGIAVVLQDEHYTSKTCPNCGNRHKPRGRNYRCPVCKFQSHRDVVGQINILSAFKFGSPGKIPAPTDIKYRIPVNHRVLRKCPDTGQTFSFLSVAQ